MKRVLFSEIAAAIFGVSVISGGTAAWAQQGGGAGAGNGAAAGAAGNGAGAAGNGAAGAAPGANAGTAGAGGAGVSGAPGSNTAAAGQGAANGPAATNSPNAGTAPANAGGNPNGAGVSGNGGVTSGTMGNTSQGNLGGSRISTLKGTDWDLNRTIAAAYESSSDLQIAQRNTEIDQKRANQKADEGHPNIEGRASATRFDQKTKVSIGGTPPVEVLGSHTETLELGISQRLDLTGQIKAATDQATLQKLADEFQVKRIRNDRSLRAETVYYNLLRAQHQMQVAQASLTTALEQQRIAQQLNGQQVGQKVDVLRANTQVANAQTELRRTQNNASIARTSFNDLVGQPLATEVVLSDLPGVSVGQATPSATATTTEPETPLFASPTAEVTAIDVNKDLQTAYTQRPDVLAQQVNVRVAEKGIKLAHAGLEPDFRLNAAGDYYPTTSFQSPRQRTAAITASITIPFYDGGVTRDKVSEAKLETENAKTTLDSLKSDVSLDVSQAYLNLTTAAAQIDNANSALQQAIKTRDLALLRYRGEVALYLEVTDAQAALQAAENNQINAVYDYQVAQAEYRHALGVLSGGQSQ
ncbi:TolC family protein [Capsulimonas corticalis]|uniref:TolC family protein n=1 Tax=Capsulimonas corticalis TaxID=2219043 RepID=UPI00140412A1|nr:TolC family protein [Capsulimonas corticalis]